jgi:Transposase IS116/IS110/IS902 family
MRCYTNPHQFYGGIDLQARSMSVCLVNRDGEILVHRHMQAAPDPFLKAVAPSRDGLVVAGEGLFTWSWLADLGAHEGIPCGLGHALDMKALHGGQAKHDTIDAHKSAARLRGGMWPQASVYPAARRATRDLLRRRTPLMRTRAARLAHVQQTHRQDNRPAIGKNIAYQANRHGVAERVADPAVHKSLAVDWALITDDDQRLTDLARSLGQNATHHDAKTFYRRRSVPGVGTMVALVRLDAMHDIHRFPRGQDVVSSGRLVTCAQEAAGQRDGTSGQTIGTASLTWAFSEAAGRCLRHHLAGQQFLAP